MKSLTLPFSTVLKVQSLLGVDQDAFGEFFAATAEMVHKLGDADYAEKLLKAQLLVVREMKKYEHRKKAQK